MHTISFRQSSLFKRGMWASAAALIAFVVLSTANVGGRPMRIRESLFAGAAAGLFAFYFLLKLRIHRLVDEVQDGGTRLVVRKGRREETVDFSRIAGCWASAGGGFHRITVRLREPGRFGGEFDFLPPAQLWGNAAAVRRMAEALAARRGEGPARKDR